MEEENNNEDNGTKKVISISLLLSLFCAFLLGFFVHIILVNSKDANIYSLTTPELINFVLSVLVSGASIVLAISAISLGKSSEKAMIDRSDESIRLQNEVFQKTTDALQRIESSTGLTEKRIEDIIAGRAGDISQLIAKDVEKGKLEPQDIEKVIRETIIQSIGKRESQLSLIPDIDSPEERKRREVFAKEKNLYEKYHAELQDHLTQRKDLRALKLGQGSYKNSGYDLFDFVFQNDKDRKFALADFGPEYSDAGFKIYMDKTLQELKLGTIDFVQIVLYGPIKPLERSFSEIIKFIDPKLGENLSLSICLPDKIAEFAKNLFI